MIFLPPKKDKKNKGLGRISLIIKDQAGRCNKEITNLLEIESSTKVDTDSGRESMKGGEIKK